MNNGVGTHQARERIARAAVDRLGGNPNDHLRMQVSCGRSHHVATVLDTDDGLVYRSVPQARSHGHRDRVDTGHGGSDNGRPWLDLLDPGNGPWVDDDLPAGCECGSRTLSRRLLLGHVAAGERRIVLT